jgi:hypothetical protein
MQASMVGLPHPYEFSELEHASTHKLVQEALRATWRLAQIEIDLARDETREQLRSGLRALLWGAAAFGSLILSLAAIVVIASVGGDSDLLVARTIAVTMAITALVTGCVAYRARPQHLLTRTRQRLEHEASWLGRYVA